jgi:hypothetical protein
MHSYEDRMRAVTSSVTPQEILRTQLMHTTSPNTRRRKKKVANSKIV